MLPDCDTTPHRCSQGADLVSAQRNREAEHLQRLLECVAVGGETEFAELYERTQGRVHGVALGPLRSIDHAREVVQEIYLEVWLTAAKYDPTKGTVMAWLKLIAYRRAVDRIRLVESSRARDANDARLDRSLRPVDFSDEVAARVDAESVHQALVCLSPIQRQAIIMKYVDGRTLRQMAELLEVPIGTVKTRLRDGLIALRVAFPMPSDESLVVVDLA